MDNLSKAQMTLRDRMLARGVPADKVEKAVQDFKKVEEEIKRVHQVRMNAPFKAEDGQTYHWVSNGQTLPELANTFADIEDKQGE